MKNWLKLAVILTLFSQAHAKDNVYVVYAYDQIPIQAALVLHELRYTVIDKDWHQEAMQTLKLTLSDIEARQTPIDLAQRVEENVIEVGRAD